MLNIKVKAKKLMGCSTMWNLRSKLFIYCMIQTKSTAKNARQLLPSKSKKYLTFLTQNRLHVAFPTIYFTPFLISPTEEVLVLNSCLQYQRLKILITLFACIRNVTSFSIPNSCDKVLVRFRKQVQISAGFSIFPNCLHKGKQSKKHSGLKIESDSGINLIPAIKDKLGLFDLSNFCRTVCSAFASGMGH